MSIKLEDLNTALSKEQLYEPLRSGGTQMQTRKWILSAFLTVTFLNTVYTTKAHFPTSTSYGLTLLYSIGVFQWQWPDGLAERLAPSLTFYSTFLSRQKWEKPSINKFVYTTHPNFSTIHPHSQTTKEAVLRMSYRIPYFVNDGEADSDTEVSYQRFYCSCWKHATYGHTC